MGKVQLQISRRTFLKGALAGSTGAALALGQMMETAAAPSENESTPWYYRGAIKRTYSVCDMCPWRCGVIVHSVNGRVYKIDGNPADPKSRGMLCARGQAGASFMYDPDRLRAPMIRTGARGEGRFQEVTWQEALDAVAEKLLAIKEQYGPESVAIFGHTSGEFWFTDYFAQA